MLIRDLGTMPYRDAWALQEAAHAEVVEGGEERILFVEHLPVITFGRRPGVERNVVTSADVLAARGVETVTSDRGGDVTFHGPGQLVAYPIIRLIDHGLSVGAYVHALEHAVIRTVEAFDLAPRLDDCAVGVWVQDRANDGGAGPLAKICAIGVRVRRGVTLHGLALNVTTDLSFFDLIIPCGLVGRRVTSLRKLLGPRVPSLDNVKEKLAGELVSCLTGSVPGLARARPGRVSCDADQACVPPPPAVR